MKHPNNGYLLTEEQMRGVVAAIHATTAELLKGATPEQRAIILENDRAVAEAVDACAQFMREFTVGESEDPPSRWERPVTDEEIREIRDWMREHPHGQR